jgi:hypothetical protein
VIRQWPASAFDFGHSRDDRRATEYGRSRAKQTGCRNAKGATGYYSDRSVRRWRPSDRGNLGIRRMVRLPEGSTRQRSLANAPTKSVAAIALTRLDIAKESGPA